MKSSKLIRILKTFSPREIKEYEKFISSPFFGCKTFVVRFFKELKRYYPEFRADDIEKRKIFFRLYENRKYNDGLIRRMTSDLIRMSEEFMAYDSFRQTDSFRNTCLLHELRIRKLDDMVKSKAAKMLRAADIKETDNVTLMNKFFVENQKINHFIKGNDDRLLESLYSASDALIGFFLSALNNKTQILHKKRKTMKADNEPVLYDNFLKFFNYPGFIKSIEDIDSKEAFFIRASYYFSQLSINNKDFESYQKCKQLVLMSKENFHGISRYNYLTALSTFCAVQIMDNNYDYLDEYFYNMELIFKENLFLTNSSVITPGVIRQIVLFSSIQKRYEYIKDFVAGYSKYFNPEHKSDLISYCNAFIRFGTGNPGKALEHSSAIGYLQPEFIKDIKILKIKIFYMLDYSDSLVSEIDSFRHYLSSENNFSAKNILKGKNFLKFILRLSKLRYNRSTKDLVVLTKEIGNENNLNEKLWLEECAAELCK